MSEKEFARVTKSPEPAPAAKAAPIESAPSVERAQSSPSVSRISSNVNGDNYWSFVFGAIILLFVAYLAGRSKLKNFLDILIPNPGPVPKVGAPPPNTQQVPNSGSGVAAPGKDPWGKVFLHPETGPQESDSAIPGLIQKVPYGVDILKGLLGK